MEKRKNGRTKEKNINKIIIYKKEIPNNSNRDGQRMAGEKKILTRLITQQYMSQQNNHKLSEVG